MNDEAMPLGPDSYIRTHAACSYAMEARIIDLLTLLGRLMSRGYVISNYRGEIPEIIE